MTSSDRFPVSVRSDAFFHGQLVR